MSPPSPRPAVRLRFAAWCACVAALLVGTPIWLLLLRGTRLLDNDPILFTGWIVLGGICLILAGLLWTTPADAIKLPARRSGIIIVVGAIWLHAWAIVCLQPLLSDDAIRYRFDGRMLLSGHSPYAVSPDDVFASTAPPIRLDSLDAMIAHSYSRTIYPPTLQAWFAILAFVERSTVSPPETWSIASGTRSMRSDLPNLPFPQRLLVWRIGHAVLAVGCVLVLLSLLKRMDRSPWWAAVVGWHPLLIVETAGMAHGDVLGVLLLLVAFHALSGERPAAAMVWIGLAAVVKPIALLAGLLVLRRVVATQPRRVPALLAVLILTVALPMLPILLHAPSRAGLLETADRYARRWAANGPVHEIAIARFREIDGDDFHWERRSGQIRAGAAIALVCLTAMLLSIGPTATGGFYGGLLVALLLSSVVYPWYLLWVMAALPLLPRWAGLTGLTWCATVVLCYSTWHAPTWDVPVRLMFVEYVPVMLAGIVEIALIFRSRDHGLPVSRAGSTIADV